jgi:ribosomal protein S18 acetylase RimI-like enzyme
MKIQPSKKQDKKEFLITQKEAFPNLDSKKQAKYFDLKIKNKEIFVIHEEDKNYAGHLCFGKHLLSPPFAKSVFVEEMAIKKKYQGKGFGSLLMKFLFNYCKKSNIIMVYVSTADSGDNKAIKFYEKLGFNIIGSLKDIDPNSEYEHGQIFLGKVLS